MLCMIIDWNKIETVLLDMDGTLLDRHFDDHFWLSHVPKRWAQQHGVPEDEAVKKLIAMFKAEENSLNWTDLDFWSEKLNLDIPLLKLEVEHLIAVHPFVIEFLLFVKQHKKQLWLVTNAHSKTLSLKMKKTKLAPYFDGIVSAHQVGLPKEDKNFWKALQEYIKYFPANTLLGEDSETNLKTAVQFGISYPIYVGRYSSQIPPQQSEIFPSITYFNQLIPEKDCTTVTLL